VHDLGFERAWFFFPCKLLLLMTPCRWVIIELRLCEDGTLSVPSGVTLSPEMRSFLSTPSFWEVSGKQSQVSTKSA
jgi:hypothetical protein